MQRRAMTLATMILAAAVTSGCAMTDLGEAQEVRSAHDEVFGSGYALLVQADHLENGDSVWYFNERNDRDLTYHVKKTFDEETGEPEYTTDYNEVVTGYYLKDYDLGGIIATQEEPEEGDVMVGKYTLEPEAVLTSEDELEDFAEEVDGIVSYISDSNKEYNPYTVGNIGVTYSCLTTSDDLGSFLVQGRPTYKNAAAKGSTPLEKIMESEPERQEIIEKMHLEDAQNEMAAAANKKVEEMVSGYIASLKEHGTKLDESRFKNKIKEALKGDVDVVVDSLEKDGMFYVNKDGKLVWTETEEEQPEDGENDYSTEDPEMMSYIDESGDLICFYFDKDGELVQGVIEDYMPAMAAPLLNDCD